MAKRGRIFSRKRKARERVCVLILEGVPYTWLRRAVDEERMPRLRAILKRGAFVPLHGVTPPEPEVVWTTFATGCNPGGHGIFGGIDRHPETMEMYAPSALDRGAAALWDVAGEAGRKSIVIGLPGTHPPMPIQGMIASAGHGPCAEIARPESFAATLERVGYCTHVEMADALRNPEMFFDSLVHSLDRRAAAVYLVDRNPWDLLLLHVPEPACLNRLFWPTVESGEGDFGEGCEEFLKRLDSFIARIYRRLPENAAFVCLSGGGFCGVRRQVDINAFLLERKFLEYDEEVPRRLADISRESTAYSLQPGRVYINLRGREAQGRVSLGVPYQEAVAKISEALLDLRDPENDIRVLHRVLWRDVMYHGKFRGKAPDLICEPRYGYDLKADLNPREIFSPPHVPGMATVDDAFLFIEGHDVLTDMPEITDLAPTILALAGVPVPEVDGSVIVSL